MFYVFLQKLDTEAELENTSEQKSLYKIIGNTF